MSVVATKEKTLDAMIADRKKNALVDVLPKIIEITTTVGMRTPTGFKYEKDGCLFVYNELTGVVTVTLGPNEQFAASVDRKTVTLYKVGSWERIFEKAYATMEASDKKEIKARFDSRYRENFGL